MGPLHPGVSIVLLAASVILGIAYARRLFRKGVDIESRTLSVNAGWILAGIAFFVAVNAAVFVCRAFPRTLWHLPLLVDYFFVPFVWTVNLICTGLLFSTVVSLAMFRRHRLRVSLLLLAVVTVLAFEYIFREMSRPVAAELGARVDDDGVIRQTSPFTCAAASCANIAQLFGGSFTEREMAHELRTSIRGTSPAQIVFGMRRLGFAAHRLSSSGVEPDAITPPAVLLIDMPQFSAGHAVAYVHRVGDKVEIWDSTRGKVLMTDTELKTVWHGLAVEIAQN